MKKLPLGIQNFKKLREENCVYVDKTAYIYRLMNEGYAYFLSRPRRFGKSLLLSTIAEVFKGNRDLFTGLWIYDKIDWKVHPIIYIDYSLIDYKQKGLYPAINDTLDEVAQQFQLQLTRRTIQEKLIELIKMLSLTNQVVILVDEYDKPIVDYIDNIPQAEQNREILKNFYSGLKGMDAHIAFLFITGVSKFSKVSIFSDLNHLFDITLGTDFAKIAGYTKEELQTHFKNHLQALVAKLNIDEKRLLSEVVDWYDGYSWDGQATVFNPYSILNLLMKKEFNNYWFTSGTPTFLVKQIKKHQLPPFKISDTLVGRNFFDSFRIHYLDPFQLLFQTGYLTIKKITGDLKKQRYLLAYPNFEVEQSFLNYLLADITATDPGRIESELTDKIINALNENDIAELFKQLNIAFAKIPYHIFIANREAYYQSVIYIIFRLIGVYIHCEIETNQGRIDTFIKTERYIYVIEYKMDSAEKALDQIKEKKYAESYLNEPQHVILLGVHLNEQKRCIDDWKAEQIR